jgi:hypothetical protein
VVGCGSRGRQLVTLKDAAGYIMKLPKTEQSLPEWQTAVACLIGAAEGHDFPMHAHRRHEGALNCRKRDPPTLPRRKRSKSSRP